MSASLYDRPADYELAFGFIDAPMQVEMIERLARRHSRIPVRRVLDLGCGPSLQLREFLRRGYDGIGLDRSTAMLRYLKRRAPRGAGRLTTIRGDLRAFRIRPPADLACCFMGTASQQTLPDWVRHLRAVSRSLRPGGLYLIENLPLLPPPPRPRGESWTIRRGGASIHAGYSETADARSPGVTRSLLRVAATRRGHTTRYAVADRHCSVSREDFPGLARAAGFSCAAWLTRDGRSRLARSAGFNLVVLRKR